MDDRLADRRAQWPADRADAPRDLSALPTHRLLSEGPGPALQPPEVSALTEPVEPDARGSPPAAVAGAPLRPPRKGEPRLHGADTCEQEAVKLQATAQVLERLSRACAAQLEQARERYQQLQTLVGAAGATTYDLEHTRLDMESYATTMLQMREEHLRVVPLQGKQCLGAGHGAGLTDGEDEESLPEGFRSSGQGQSTAPVGNLARNGYPGV